MPVSLLESLHTRYVRYQANTVAPLITGTEKLLDFGCGDLGVLELLKKRYPKLSATGIDVVDPNRRLKSIRFFIYDGEHLPFQDGTFDTVISYHVYHHCDDPKAKFLECVRVAKSNVIFIESVIRSRLDNIGIRLTDWVFNSWRAEEIPMPYHFLSLAQWYRIFTTNGLTLVYEQSVGVLPSILPIGGTYVFNVSKKKVIR